MQTVSTITVLLALSLALAAQPSGVHADVNPAAEGEIKALELKLAALIVRGDWDEYAQHLVSDYLHTHDNGHVETRDEALTSLRGVQGEARRKIIVMEMEPADLAIRIYGDTALSDAEFTISVRESGQVKTRRTRITDIFVKRDGQWYLIAGQGTTIGK